MSCDLSPLSHRYVQFDLVGRFNTSAQFALNFVSCHYANSLMLFALRGHGFMVPPCVVCHVTCI